jgi:hypothetical protein
MRHIQLKTKGAIYNYTIYKFNEVQQILEEINKKCNNSNEFNYIKKLAGFKKDYLVFLDDLYNFMVEMEKFNEVFNRPESTQYIDISNKGVLSGQVQTIAKLFNRSTIFRKALDSINMLVEYNNMLDEYSLVKNKKEYIFIEKTKVITA